jgi:hypothetical protein
MKSVSTLGLAALLASGAVVVTAAPAVAQDKKAKPAKANFSPAFLKAAQPAQAALKADPATAEPAVAAAEAAASTDDDKYQVGLMRVQVEQAKLRSSPTGDSQVLRAPLEALLANPKTTPEQRANFGAVLGRLAYQRKDYASAVTIWTQAQQAGSADAELPNLIRQARLLSGDTAGAAASYEAAITAAEAKGQKAAELDYRVAIDAYQKSKQGPQAIAALRRWVAAYPTTKNWRDALYIFGLQRGSLATLDRAQTIDVFRLLRQTRSLDGYAYAEYAQKVVDTGLPDEGKAVLSEGIASGQVQRNPTINALVAQTERQIGLQGSLAPLETKAQSAANGNLAYQTGDAYLGQKNYAKAVALYRTALQKGGVDANLVNTHLGIALALSGDKAGARTAFEAVKGGTRADIAQFWIVWLDHPATA